MRTIRPRAKLIVAAVLVAVGAIIVIPRALATSPHLDLPQTQPATIFPATWSDSSSPYAGKWQLRDSATTAPSDLAFDYRMHWPFPKQEFLLVMSCDRGTLHFLWGSGDSSARCTGHPRALVQSTLPNADQVTVSETQRDPWGIAIYSRLF
jgi:hypothetical protein